MTRFESNRLAAYWVAGLDGLKIPERVVAYGMASRVDSPGMSSPSPLSWLRESAGMTWPQLRRSVELLMARDLIRLPGADADSWLAGDDDVAGLVVAEFVRIDVGSGQS